MVLIMSHARAARANQLRAIIIVSFHFVLSCCIDPKSILYAPIMINITAIVPAIHIKKSIAALIAFGISSRCTFPDRRSGPLIHKILSVSSAKVELAVVIQARSI
jgi:hypothetical protein